MVQATQILAGQKEGGFFIMIGRKLGVPSEAGPPEEPAVPTIETVRDRPLVS